MKTYPSIPRRPRGQQRQHRLHLFDKIDGNNLRFEWSAKKGWHRFGTRRQLVDATHPTYGIAMSLFTESFAEPIGKTAVDNGWDALTAFAELAGPSSLGGRHVEGETKSLTLFDVAPYRRGFIGPERFIDLFGDLEIPRHLGVHVWDDELVSRVRRGDMPGVTFEGVVGKAGEGHRVVMAKAKTQAWVDRILERYGPDVGEELASS